MAVVTSHASEIVLPDQKLSKMASTVEMEGRNGSLEVNGWVTNFPLHFCRVMGLEMDLRSNHGQPHLATGVAFALPPSQTCLV
jgi:hypothetical protein